MKKLLPLIVSLSLSACSQRLHISPQTGEIFELLTNGKPVTIKPKDKPELTITPGTGCIASSLLDSCVRQFNKTNGNPNLSLTGNYTGNGQPSAQYPQGRSHFKPTKRTSYVYNANEFPFQTLTPSLQKQILQDRIDELSHAKQLKECGFLKYVQRNRADLKKRSKLVEDKGYATHTKKVTKKRKTNIQTILHPHDRGWIYKKDVVAKLPYDSLYYQPGACEHNAHFVVKFQLVTDFLKLLGEKADSSSLADMTLMAQMSDGYFWVQDMTLRNQYHTHLFYSFFEQDYACYEEHCQQHNLAPRPSEELVKMLYTKI